MRDLLFFFAGCLTVFGLRFFVAPDLHASNVHDHVFRALSYLQGDLQGTSTSQNTFQSKSSIVSSLSSPQCTDPSWKENFLYDAEDPKSASLGRGLHYLCVTTSSASSSGLKGLQVTPYLNAVESRIPPSPFSFPSAESLSLNLQELMGPQERRDRDFVLYDGNGLQLFTERELLTVSSEIVQETLSRAGLVLLFEGAVFIWPGVRVGHQRNVSISGTGYQGGPNYLTLETLTLRPLLFGVVEQFVSNEECNHIQNRSRPHMKQSGVSLMDKDKGKAATEWRTSSTYFLPSGMDQVLRGVDHRVESLTKISKKNQEQIQVLNYGVEQKYDGHHDFFDPKMYANDKNTMKLIENGRRNRVATVFFYLSDVAGGGETMFFCAHGKPAPKNLADCSPENGHKVKPEKGKVIIFYSLDFAGKTDPFSLHGGCPVLEGEKWSGNKWIWNSAMHFSEYNK
ncbi:hypothetical protein TrLO_g15713 [Triparma laevis f. longispina]|uniref:Fe2OG dioxygenase domain-containing protein n=1 Tax=Triparma laevis f. longispina TaxID=1714387 RepID=A0A9W7KVH0_9STRA|nr:hypothetical protein TrLO_g15713 [Triparma laevis f. longispina]